MNKRIVVALSALGLSALACGGNSASRDNGPRADVVAANMDTTVDPGIDFFKYANGAWLARNPIPASESAWGIGNAVQEDIYTKIRAINESAAKKKAAHGSDEQKIGDFWETGMDSTRADQLGLKPVQPQLDRIASIKTPNDALDVAQELYPLGVGAFFSMGISQDEKASDVMAVHLYQGGLGLPERDFYFNNESGVANIRKEYVAHIARSLKMLGRDSAAAAAAANKVMQFETALATASRKLEDLRDPNRNYNKMAPAAITSRFSPGIRWGERFARWKLQPDSVIVGQPEFFKALDGLLKNTPIDVLQDYMRIQLMGAYGEYLSRDWDAENFRFYDQVLNGRKEMRPRWKRVMDSEEAAMGMVLGRLFVKEYFPPRAKQRYENLVEAIRDAYKARIDNLDWMSDSTKAKAQQKLASITKKVGYPDKWKDYSALDISRDSYAQNMMAAARWNFNDRVSRYGKPVDRTEWEMTPQTYNAYYNPSNNEIVLPAGIFMVPGTPDSLIDDAVVYGYAGASTIGHEITHGFDDEGRQFDAQGNLKDWWTPEDAKRFNQRAAVMVKQFDEYEPIKGLHINGKATLGENIADYGGVLLGIDAFKKTEQFKKGEKIAGLTPMQRYFLGYALGWLGQRREESLRNRLLSDVHSPGNYRVIGPFANIPEFYEAFNIRPGQPMWRADSLHVRIW
jgi:putative endopeptidase